MRFLFITIFFFAAECLKAQPNSSVRFSSLVQAGALYGGNGTKLGLQLINGVRYKTYFLGIGAGLDFYYERSVPVFLSAHKLVRNRNNTPFFYADAGANIPLKKDIDLRSIDGPLYSYHGGIYYDIGAGYRASENGKVSVLFSIGYSLKKMTERTESYWMGPEPFITETEFFLRRLVVKAGLSF